MKVVKEHIQILLRLLAIQFENERKDKDFDSNTRLLQQAHAVRTIIQKRTFDLKGHLQRLMRSQNPDYPEQEPLPVTEDEMRQLEDKLLQYIEETKQPVTLKLPMHTQETCWNNVLTQDQKNEEVFIGKCGECQAQHEYPKCDQCKQPRKKSGPCSECKIQQEEGRTLPRILWELFPDT